MRNDGGGGIVSCRNNTEKIVITFFLDLIVLTNPVSEKLPLNSFPETKQVIKTCRSLDISENITDFAKINTFFRLSGDFLPFTDTWTFAILLLYSHCFYATTKKERENAWLKTRTKYFRKKGKMEQQSPGS